MFMSFLKLRQFFSVEKIKRFNLLKLSLHTRSFEVLTQHKMISTTQFVISSWHSIESEISKQPNCITNLWNDEWKKKEEKLKKKKHPSEIYFDKKCIRNTCHARMIRIQMLLLLLLLLLCDFFFFFFWFLNHVHSIWSNRHWANEWRKIDTQY